MVLRNVDLFSLLDFRQIENWAIYKKHFRNVDYNKPTGENRNKKEGKAFLLLS
jgi:hypothetical protein